MRRIYSHRGRNEVIFGCNIAKCIPGASSDGAVQSTVALMDQQACIRLATPADAAAIGALRVEAFEGSSDFRIANARFVEKLRWTDEDDAAEVIAAWRENEPVATMRLEVISDRHHLTEYAAGLMPPADHVEWPALALARVATHSSCSRTGLNSLIRYYALQAALASEARRLYSYVVLGAARTKLMASLGYQFVTRSDGDPDLASQRPWALAWLDLSGQGRQALALLERQISATKQEYPWVGPKPRVPRLRCFG
jgi:predicted N-acetyltransferase YhbS